MRKLFGLVSLRVGLVSALLLGLPALAVGQSAVNGSSLPFHVTADTMEGKDGGRFLVAQGNVRVSRRDWTLYADEVEIDQQEKIFIARGSVLIFDLGNQIEGSSLRYNYGTGQGVVYEARGLLLPATTFTAEELYREDDRTYRLVSARYTSCAVCQTPPYDWQVRAAEVTIHPEEFAWGTHGTFWLKGIPALYVPVFRHPLVERQTGFLTPGFGGNSEEGFILEQEFFWAISDSQDATLGVIYRSERGLSPTVEYRYILEEGSGLLYTQFLHDRKLDEDRYLVRFQHQQNFTPALTGKADINARSDRDFPFEFQIGFPERSNLVNSSTAFLTYTLPRHTVSLAGQFQETRLPGVPRSDSSFLRGPELTVSSVAQPLWEESPLLFGQISNFVYFDRENDITLARLDVSPSLSLPIPVTSYITFTPRVGLRETFYSRGPRDIERDSVTREMVEFETTLSSSFSRTFPVSGKRLRGILHTVEPSIRYLYIPDVVQDDLPQLDGTDFISPQNRLFFSLTNRFSASVRDPNGARRRFDFLTLTLETSVAPDPQTRTFTNLFLSSLQPENITQAVEKDRRPIPVPGRPGFSKATERDVANIVGRMSITPPWPLSLDISGSLDPETNEIETGNARMNASYKDVASFVLGYTFSRQAESRQEQETLIGQLDLTILEGTRLTYLGRYDAEREVFVEQQAGLIYQTCCWALNIIYTRRETEEEQDPEDDIRVNFEILTAGSRR
ncbi:MAG: LPS-assembly protein LptD [Candidatus Methylomirabilales bacterium]